MKIDDFPFNDGLVGLINVLGTTKEELSDRFGSYLDMLSNRCELYSNNDMPIIDENGFTEDFSCSGRAGIKSSVYNNFDIFIGVDLSQSFYDRLLKELRQWISSFPEDSPARINGHTCYRVDGDNVYLHAEERPEIKPGECGELATVVSWEDFLKGK